MVTFHGHMAKILNGPRMSPPNVAHVPVPKKTRRATLRRSVQQDWMPGMIKNGGIIEDMMGCIIYIYNINVFDHIYIYIIYISCVWINDWTSNLNIGTCTDQYSSNNQQFDDMKTSK
jgi:hypothetical protein